MPRRNLPPRKAQAALLAIELEKATYEIRALRRAEREAEAARALRRATPDWVDLDRQLKQLQLEAEMDAMEACLDERRPKIPILNFNLMPGFTKPVTSETAPLDPEVHPDVKIPADLLAAQDPLQDPWPANENRPPPPGGKNWKYDSIADGYDPADDWRNWT